MYKSRFSSQKALRMAIIADTFTYDCFEPECDAVLLTPSNWREVLQSGDIDLLLVESVWTGKNNVWLEHFRDGKKFETLAFVADLAKDNDVPSVFWNKEDPFHFSEFIELAGHFGYVFTTDMGCIAKYKQILNHDRIFWLPFAAQPLLHNPAEEYERIDGFCFAGAFYARYPWRGEFMDNLIASKGEKTFAIYERKGQNGESMYPEKYEPYIQGTLPYNEISKAYKGYTFGVNLTSMNYSCTMFARRVFELLACGTVCVGNYSRGIKTIFGELVLTTNSIQTLSTKISALKTNEIYSQVKKDGVAFVFAEHLYEHRLAYIVSKVFGWPFINNDTDELRKKYNIRYSLEELYHYAESIRADNAKIVNTSDYGLSELYETSDFELQSGIVYKFDGCINISSRLREKQAVWVRAGHLFRISDFTSTLSVNIFAEAEISAKCGKANIQIEFYDADKNKISWINFNYNEDSEIQIPSYAIFFIFIFRLEGEANLKIRSIKSYSRSLNLPGLVPITENLVVAEHKTANDSLCEYAVSAAKRLCAELLIVPNSCNLAPYDETDGIQIARGNYGTVNEYAETGKIKTMYFINPSDKLKSVIPEMPKLDIKILNPIN